MPSAVGGQHLVDAAHGRDLLHVGIHLLVARRGKHAPASEARLVPLVAAQDFERGRKQRDAAHDGGLFARLWIHHRPSSSCERCSRRRWSASAKASPVRQQKTKTSRMRASRWSSSLRVSSSSSCAVRCSLACTSSSLSL